MPPIVTRSGMRFRRPMAGITKIWVVGTAIVVGIVTFAGMVQAEEPLRITVIFDNVPCDSNMITSWGFSCLVEFASHTILFDTGGDGNILLANMKGLHVDPKAIHTVVLSHIHADHTGGLESLLRVNPKVAVYMPGSFPDSFQQATKSYGADVRTVDRPTRLFDRVYSSGEMGDSIKEQALILDTLSGLVIITGCAHPGVANVVRKAKEKFKKDVYLVMGGFHLGGMSDGQIKEIISTLKEMGVKKVAPSHCTGEKAMALFGKAWGDDFVEAGAGAIIQLQ